ANPFNGLTTSSTMSYSFAFWMKTSDATNNHDIFGWGTYDFCEINVSAGGHIACDGDGDSTGGVASTNSLADNSWHHVAFTRSSGNIEKLYIDGVLDTTSATGGQSTVNPTAEFCIGFREFGGYF